jgi:inorganic triphosphatase YgiF
MDQHLEIEAKYDLGADDELPDLMTVAGIDAVRQQPTITLTASYFDTEDHALLRRGITLRRREGGADEGWHLKVKVADGQRLELQRPLGRATRPPATLTGLLSALAAPADLHPAATLVTHRTVQQLVAGDTVLAELSDDVVTATRGQSRRSARAGNAADADVDAVSGDADAATVWREVEVELVDGDATALTRVDKVLRRAGLRPSSAASKVGRVLAADSAATAKRRTGRKATVSELLVEHLRAATDTVLGTDPLLRVGLPGTARHQAKTLRQVLTLLALLREHRPATETRAIDQPLTTVLDACRSLALVEEAKVTIDSILRDEPRDLVMGPVRRRADRELAAVTRAATSALAEAQSSPSYLEALAALQVLSDSTNGTNGKGEDSRDGRAAKVLPVVTQDAGKRLERRLSRLADADSTEEAADRAAAAARTAAAVLVTDALASSVSARSIVPRAIVEDCSSLLWRLAVLRRAQDLLREMGVQAHLAGENGFSFGRAHGLVERSAAWTGKRLARRRKQLGRARRDH